MQGSIDERAECSALEAQKSLSQVDAAKRYNTLLKLLIVTVGLCSLQSRLSDESLISKTALTREPIDL